MTRDKELLDIGKSIADSKDNPWKLLQIGDIPKDIFTAQYEFMAAWELIDFKGREISRSNKVAEMLRMNSLHMDNKDFSCYYFRAKKEKTIEDMAFDYAETKSFCGVYLDSIIDAFKAGALASQNKQRGEHVLITNPVKANK